MDIFKHDEKLKQLAEELKKNDIKMCNDAANLKELQKKHPELKQICENYNSLKEEKENHIRKLLEYLESISATTLSKIATQQLNLEIKTLTKMLEQLRK